MIPEKNDIKKAAFLFEKRGKYVYCVLKSLGLVFYYHPQPVNIVAITTIKT